MKRAAMTLLLLSLGCSAGATEAVPSASPVVTTTAASPTALPTPTGDGCPPRAALPRGSVLSVIGDSYTSGEEGKGGVGEKGWPAILARRLGWTVHNDAHGGSGYLGQVLPDRTYDGPLFIDQVPKLRTQRPDVVIVFGSDNDRTYGAARLAAKTRETLAAVKRAAPTAQLVVATTFIHDDEPAPDLDRVRDVAQDETARIPCAVFVDPMAEHWFSSATTSLFYPNDDHPTDAGHARLAALWQRTLTRLGYVD